MGYEQSLDELNNVFKDSLKSDWKHIVAERYPEPLDPANVPPEHDRSSATNFYNTIEAFLKRHLKEEKPADRQYIYLAPGGDYSVHKELMTSPVDHLHRFEEMLRITTLMPPGDIPSPISRVLAM